MIRTALVTCFSLVAIGLTSSPILAQPGGARGGGPPFCQSGQGHPVHGWSWCVSRGWAPATQYPAWLRGWDVIRWQDARFQHRQPVRYDRWMGQDELIAILGETVLRRLAGQHGTRDRRTPVRGRWVQQGFEGLVLEVAAGSTPLAYLQDTRRDGRVDRVYLRPR
jgi:hypothetical protein